jgi:mannose-6-phosphate isomerase class I
VDVVEREPDQDLMQLVADSGLVARMMGAGSPPSLSVRLPSPPNGPHDPMQGHELWHAVTDTVVLLGPRSTRMAERLLDHLTHGDLKRLRMRMSAAELNTPPDSKIGTMSAITTLACWPGKRRKELVTGVAQCVTEALVRLPVTRTGSTATALRWLVKLAEDFPEDPLALAPVLLQLRKHEAGTTYLVPPGWLHAHLSGSAVGLASVHTETVCGGLDPAAVDGGTFVTAISSERPEHPLEPGPHTLRYAARLATDLGASSR